MTSNGTHTRERPIRVALVDDHQLVLDGLAARLAHSDLGISVLAVEARWTDLLAHEEFPFDVVVLDLNLGDNIPIGAKLRALRTVGSSAVVMSRHADSASVSAAMQAGALGFVPKTESADELIAAIQSAASSERHLSPELETALEDFAATPEALVGKQEQRALVLYASGRSIREVAAEMGTTEETIKSYIKRARRKYRTAGIDLGTRVLLRRHGARAGWIPTE